MGKTVEIEALDMTVKALSLYYLYRKILRKYSYTLQIRR